MIEASSKVSCGHQSPRGKQISTFPDSSPKDVSVVCVHHYPLAIEGILVDRAGVGIEVSSVEQAPTRRVNHIHVAARVIARDVSASCYAVFCAGVWTKSSCRRRRVLSGMDDNFI